MKIDTNYPNADLRFREILRLTSFINLMCETRPSDCIDSSFSYDIYADEPTIILESGNMLYASDYDIAFTCDNKACYVLDYPNE